MGLFDGQRRPEKYISNKMYCRDFISGARFFLSNAIILKT